jgi:hypothetical protein
MVQVRHVSVGRFDEEKRRADVDLVRRVVAGPLLEDGTIYVDPVPATSGALREALARIWRMAHDHDRRGARGECTQRLVRDAAVEVAFEDQTLAARENALGDREQDAVRRGAELS